MNSDTKRNGKGLNTCYSATYKQLSQTRDQRRFTISEARLVIAGPAGACRRDQITPVLRQMHWLPVCQRVVFKVAGLGSPVTGWSRACVPHRRLPSTV